MKPEISIIIPTLNEEDSLEETLNSLMVFDNAEIIIVDGGSRDKTLAIAENYAVKILRSPQRGRGVQLQLGGQAAAGDILWFLHADTRPVPGCVREMKNALAEQSIVGGNFSINFDGKSFGAQFLNWLYPNLAQIGLIYGDSAIFVRREIYQRMGGFKPFPIFEDLDFVERLKKEGSMVTLSSIVTTSSRRFEDKSFFLTFLRWTILQLLYWLGFSPDTLLKIYFPSSKPKEKRKP